MSEFWAALVGAVVGGVLTFLGAWGLKHLDDRRKRQTLTTGLLSEIRLLEDSLWRIHSDPTAAWRVIETFQTAVYDQAGADLLLLKPATMHVLYGFYTPHEPR